VCVCPLDHTKYRILKSEEIRKAEPLLEKILDQGKLVYKFPSIEEIRYQRIRDMDCLDLGIKRIVTPIFITFHYLKSYGI